MKAELVLDARAAIGESPVWVAPESALYWTDIKAPALFRTIIDTGATTRWDVTADIGAYALDGQGRALVALRIGLYWLDLASGELTLQVASPFDPANIRFNEGACDSTGRFWVGTMTDPLSGGECNDKALLYSFTSQGGLIPHADLSFLINGMAWNADETIFYLSHSFACTVFAFDYDKQAGTLRNRTEFIRIPEGDGIPDGAAVDVQGGYWCAMHGGGRLHRYTSDGTLDQVVELPVSQPTMCCFGGDDLATLYVTSAREKLDEAALQREPLAGGLFKLTPEIPGQAKSWRVS